MMRTVKLRAATVRFNCSNRRDIFCCLIACMALLSTVFPIAGQDRAPNRNDVALVLHRLQSWYNPETGLYRTTGWWNSANAITVLVDDSRVTATSEFLPVLSNTFTAAQKTSSNFLNNYYDDEGWWALAWLDAYELTHNTQYLQMAEVIFHDMRGGWDATCDGGIWWSKDRKYKNAIANELFLSVAAQLATQGSSRADRKEYARWAEREWKWFAHSGMINGQHLINDGLDDHCQNNGKITWTYNQGVLLGGLAAMDAAHHNAHRLEQGRAIVSAVLNSPTLVDAAGVLHDVCEPKCGADGTQFKGIFMRNLAAFDAVTPSPAVAAFLEKNAAVIWKNTQSSTYEIGENWATSQGAADASTESSGADALVAALRRAN